MLLKVFTVCTDRVFKVLAFIQVLKRCLEQFKKVLMAFGSFESVQTRSHICLPKLSKMSTTVGTIEGFRFDVVTPSIR